MDLVLVSPHAKLVSVNRNVAGATGCLWNDFPSSVLSPNSLRLVLFRRRGARTVYATLFQPLDDERPAAIAVDDETGRIEVTVAGRRWTIDATESSSTGVTTDGRQWAIQRGDDTRP